MRAGMGIEKLISTATSKVYIGNGSPTARYTRERFNLLTTKIGSTCQDHFLVYALAMAQYPLLTWIRCSVQFRARLVFGILVTLMCYTLCILPSTYLCSIFNVIIFLDCVSVLHLMVVVEERLKEVKPEVNPNPLCSIFGESEYFSSLPPSLKKLINGKKEVKYAFSAHYDVAAGEWKNGKAPELKSFDVTSVPYNSLEAQNLFLQQSTNTDETYYGNLPDRDEFLNMSVCIKLNNLLTNSFISIRFYC